MFEARSRVVLTWIRHFRSSSGNGHHQIGPFGPVRADIVAKVVLHKVSKIPRAAGAFFV
jgi:hypothetical protein